ncbi:MAG: hypothetical protein ACYC1I_04375 [Acidimicrobiales bacterium]
MANGVIALLGSGETAPGMTKIHRQIFARLNPLRAVNLDTTYGFQENVPQMSKKLEDYFATSLNVDIETLHFSSYEESSEFERAQFKLRIRESNYVFAGPGSPTYALSQWSPLDLASDLASVLDHDGTVCFASAAAVTLGAFTAPVYEIYKVGTAPHWREGLNFMASIGLNCVVIPHFDNNEGGNYDTSRCYLGERRLKLLEAQLPDGVATLGIDEHTALVFDLAEDTLQVRGRSNGYWRLNGVTRNLANGETIALEELRTLEVHRENANVPAPPRPTGDPNDLAERVLAGGDDALGALATLVKLATAGADGYIDPTMLIGRILEARVAARAAGQYEVSDQLRDALVESGVEVTDLPSGTTWSFKNSSANP